MLHETHYPILAELGINSSEAMIYELLLEKGQSPALDLVTPSGLGRGNVYNALTALKKKGLVTEKEGKKTVYEAVPPTHLTSLVKKEKERVDQLARSLEAIMPMLSSEYALSTGRPTIEVFEGIEGAEQAVMDSVKAKSDILTYYDFEALQGPFEKLDERYYRAYTARGLHKRILTSDSPKARGYFNEPLKNTQVAFVPKFPTGFSAALQIYDDTIAFISIKDDKLISVLVRDAVFAKMMRLTFEFHWSLAKDVLQPRANDRPSSTSPMSPSSHPTSSLPPTQSS